MHRIYHVLPEVAVAAIFLIPFFLYRRKKHSGSSTVTLLSILFALYLCAVYAIAGLPSVTYLRYSPHCNFTPFLYMFSDRTNSFLNVMLFVPMGFFLPVLWKKFQKIGWTLLFGLFLSLFIEVMQVFTYRATDINDLITNTAGTILGFLLGKTTIKLVSGFSADDQVKSLGTVLIAVFGVMFFIQPLILRIIVH